MRHEIDTSGWKEFKLTDIFVMSNTKSIVQSQLIPDSGSIPYITASKLNNGVMTYVDCPDEWIDKGNCIVIGGKTLTFTYQEHDFCSNDSHNIALYMKDNDVATKNHFLFLISALNAALNQRFNWDDSISMKRAVKESFYLPATPSGDPDWDYMDAYMSKMLAEEQTYVEKLSEHDFAKHEIDTSRWKEFVIGNLFEISRPIARSKDSYADGDVPFVASGCFNNGVIAMVAPHDDEQIDDGNCLTVSPLDGCTFYQPADFLGRGGAGSAIIILRNESLTLTVGLFIATVLSETLKAHSYIDQISSTSIAPMTIKLPATPSGDPDWDYMDAYMSKILGEEKRKADEILKNRK